MAQTLIEIEGLSVSFETEQGRIKAIDDVGFSLEQGGILGIVGESGCGKSVTAMSLMRLLPQPSARIESGSIEYRGQDIVTLPKEDLYKIRGHKIAMIFQEPMTALNPVYRIGRQMLETYTLHFPHLSMQDKMERCLRLLGEVGIPEAEKRLREYPHQLSGGMRQRVMIAMALACEPDLLIADEPTTALDVTTQAQILDLMLRLRKEKGMGIIMITHDLGVIAEVCEQVLVMYAGRVAEHASVRELFKDPKHPYTRGLLSSMPSLSHKHKSRLSTIDGMVPPLTSMPEGCRFEQRCPYRIDKCKMASPPKTSIGEGRWVRCFRSEDIESWNGADS